MSHNIIVMQYCRAAVAGILRWMTSCAILGMTASCLAHEATPKEARAALTVNLVSVSSSLDRDTSLSRKVPL